MSQTSASAAAHRPLDRAWTERFSRQLLAVWNEHDTSHLAEFVTEDVVWIDPALDRPAHGVDGVRRFMEDCWRSIPDLHFVITGPKCFAEDAPILTVPWRMTGTHLGPIDPPGYAPTGRHIDVEGVDVYTFRGDRVAHYRACYDNAEVARQLGLLPARGSRTEKLLARAQRLTLRLRRSRR